VPPHGQDGPTATDLEPELGQEAAPETWGGRSSDRCETRRAVLQNSTLFLAAWV
jgi:hypothetical protein